MIQVTNLTKKFKLSKQQKKKMHLSGDWVTAVDDISLQCNPGRIFSLLGPNGAGKTTTLRLISTLLQPTNGSVQVAGLDTQKDGQQVRGKIGFLTGSTGLYDRLTPEEVVSYFGKLNGMDSETLKKRRNELFQMLGIHKFSGKRIGELSSGMKQKVSIARTMIHDPEVVIFDEPTSGLDVITAESIIDLIRQCKEQNKTVIFSSHIMSEVDLLCDDLAIIHDGNILYNDTMEQFRSQMQSDSLTKEFIRIINEHQN
jgi:sodium transport system ATP-binding protein